MKFAEPHILYYLLIILAIGSAFSIWSAAGYKKAGARFAEDKLLKKIDPYHDYKVFRLRIFLNMIAIFFIGVALSRPQWGMHWEEKKNRGIDILIALDASKSMLAQDVSPSRFEFAKGQIRDFVRGLAGDRVGLIGFSGDAFLFCPFTMDYSSFITSLNSVKVGSVARGGTSFTGLISEAVRDFKWAISKNKIIVIISDGGETEGDVKEAVLLAKSAGVRIFCIGVGTKDGTTITYIDDKGNESFIKDESGKIVRSRLDEDALRSLSSATEGLYEHATRERQGFELIYEKALSKLKKQETEEAIARTYSERFQIPLLFAVLVLFAEMVLRIKKRNEETH